MVLKAAALNDHTNELFPNLLINPLSIQDTKWLWLHIVPNFSKKNSIPHCKIHFCILTYWSTVRVNEGQVNFWWAWNLYLKYHTYTRLEVNFLWFKENITQCIDTNKEIMKRIFLTQEIMNILIRNLIRSKS